MDQKPFLSAIMEMFVDDYLIDCKKRSFTSESSPSP